MEQAHALLGGGREGVREWNLWRRKALLVPPKLNDIDLSGASLNGANLSNLSLRGANLRRAKLRGAVLVGSDLRGANLDDASLPKANLSGASFADASLRRAHLRNARLHRTLFTGADLCGAELHRSELIEAKLDRCRLEGAFLPEADLSRAELLGARLSGAFLGRCRLRGARLGGADLSGSLLKGADFTGASLVSTDLDSADLTSANFSQATLRSVNFQNAIMRDTVLADVDLSDLAVALTSVVHRGPSLLAMSSLMRSCGRVPDAFLRGCGLQEWEIAARALYDPQSTEAELASVQERVNALRSADRRRFRPVFLSFGESDRRYAEILTEILDQLGLRSWQDPKADGGDTADGSIRRGVRDSDVVFLFLSTAALRSDWLKGELHLAEKQLRAGKSYALCPLVIEPCSDGKAARTLGQLLEKHHGIDLSRELTRDAWEAKLGPLFRQLELALDSS